jgi:hypothetical protein
VAQPGPQALEAGCISFAQTPRAEPVPLSHPWSKRATRSAEERKQGMNGSDSARRADRAETTPIATANSGHAAEAGGSARLHRMDRGALPARRRGAAQPSGLLAVPCEICPRFAVSACVGQWVKVGRAGSRAAALAIRVAGLPAVEIDDHAHPHPKNPTGRVEPNTATDFRHMCCSGDTTDKKLTNVPAADDAARRVRARSLADVLGRRLGTYAMDGTSALAAPHVGGRRRTEPCRAPFAPRLPQA